MSVIHVAFAPHGPDAVVTTALTELVFLYIPMPAAPPKGQEQDAAQTGRLAAFTETSRSKIREVEAVTGGWAVEVVDHNGQDVRVFVVLVGWRSEAAYTAAVNRPETQTAFETLAGPAVNVQRETVPFLVPI
jgi:Antibiotic biosynthesis monooxygenase